MHLSKDGKIVVIHDANTNHVADFDKNVADQSLEELRILDVGKWKGAKFTGERIPTLEEVLETVPEGKRVLIEVKCGVEIVPELCRVLKVCKFKPDQISVISFAADVIEVFKRARPDLNAYWLVSLSSKNTKPPTADELIERANVIKADGLDLSATPEILNRSYGDKVKAAGFRLYVWTVNDPDLAKAMLAAGAEGITTDRPAWLRNHLHM